jgi:hypothetical protein
VNLLYLCETLCNRNSTAYYTKFLKEYTKFSKP